MKNEYQHPPGGRKPANDNSPTPGETELDKDIAPWKRLEGVVLDIARLIGRQIAREDFERLRAAAANDNKPPIAGAGGGEGSKD